jgi:hypothetical protein
MPTSGYGVAEFTASITDAANGVLPYIGAGVAAGVIVLAVTWGIRKGLGMLKGVGGK